MTVITKEMFENNLIAFCQMDFTSHYHKFIPCIEYSKEMWPHERYYNNNAYNVNVAQWNCNKYYLNPTQIYNYSTGSYDCRYPDPIGDYISIFDRVMNDIENNQYPNKFVSKNGVQNDIFLEFDFKNLYDSNHRQKLFGERNESEAFKYYYDTAKRNNFLVEEMKLVKSRNVGDIARASVAYDEFTNDSSFDKLSRCVHDFTPWLSRFDYNYYASQLKPTVDKKKLKITDFYNIVPDDPSAEDLIKVYAQHKPFIESLPKEYNIDVARSNKIYNPLIRDAINDMHFNMNVFLLAVFTKDEFEQLFYNHHKHLRTEHFKGYEQFRTQDTIANAIKLYHEWANKQPAHPYGRSYYEDTWPNYYPQDCNYKYIIFKITNDIYRSNLQWSGGKVTVQVVK